MNEGQMTRPSHRRTVAETVASHGAFAVMRHTTGRKRAAFSCWHETEQSAIEEAQRLTAESIAMNGPTDVCFYVMRVEARAGIIAGKLVQR